MIPKAHTILIPPLLILGIILVPITRRKEIRLLFTSSPSHHVPCELTCIHIHLDLVKAPATEIFSCHLRNLASLSSAGGPSQLTKSESQNQL